MLQQRSIVKILEKIDPPVVTIETNATQPLKEFKNVTLFPIIHMSCSPKLFSVSGEKDAIKLDVLKQYYDFADTGCLKFVHNGTQQAWDELDGVMDKIHPHLKEWSFWVMPVGSTAESQQPNFLGKIAMDAMKRGFNVSMRTHIQAFGNQIGT